MVVRMRHTRSHTANRRSHHALKARIFSVDTETGVPHLRHHVCTTTGMYRGKKILEVNKKSIKKAEKMAKAKK